jgi:hypothetical protein
MEKKIYGFIGATLIIFFFLPVTQAQSDLESARTSVVKVTTGFSVRNPNSGRLERRLGTGTGFSWQESMYVVTALHVVAGVNEITVHNSSGKTSGASIVNVLLEADLALLKLNSDLGLIPLKLEPVNPNTGNNYTIWGFPHAVFKMQDNEIRLSRSLEANPILDHLINGDKLKYELEKQKYPSPNVSILKIASIIQPGQSGAPLLTSDGKVVGIADGGLRGGTALLNWAMPAATYVPRLSSSRDPIPSMVSIQSSLFNSSTTILADDMPADSEEEYDYDYYQILASAESENTIHMNGQYITRTWTASFNDIISTLSKEEAGDLMKVLQEFDVNMDDTYYDIYEDYDSGATITIPYGEQFDVADGWFYTCNADESLCYYVLPWESDDFEEANDQAIALFNYFLESGEWETYGDFDEVDEIEFDEDEEEATYSFTRFAANEGDDRVLQYTADIIGSGLLVGILVYDESKMEDNNYLKQFLHFMLSLEMRDFAKY